MFKKLSLFLVFILLALSPVSATDWIIEGDSVYVNDSNAYISVSPHTLQESGDIIVNLTSKKYTGNIDVVFGFDVPNIKPLSAGLYNPTYSNVTKSYTCSPPNWYNYTLSPKQFRCWYNSNIPIIDNQTNETTYINSTILIFDHSFETANLSTKTAYWNETVFTEYTDVSNAFTKVNYDYGGMNTWYFRKNVPVIANQSKQLKVTVQVPIKLGENSGKYWVAIKPSDDALTTAIANGHLYVLDPWYNSSWSYVRIVTVNHLKVTNTQTNFPIMLQINQPTNINANGSDVRITDDSNNELPREIESYNQTTGNLTVLFKGNISNATNTAFNIFYGNSLATEPANDSTYGSQKVWEGNYSGVWHMNQAPDVGIGNEILDSTSNMNHGNSTRLPAGALINANYGLGINYTENQGSQYIRTGTIGFPTNYPLSLEIYYKVNMTTTSTFILSRPAYNDSWSTPYFVYGLFYDGLLAFDMNNTQLHVALTSAGNQYILATYDGANKIIYQNDSSPVSGAYTANAGTPQGDFFIGNRNAMISGTPASVIYEVRISKTNRSDGYRLTTFNNLNNPTANGTDAFFTSVSPELTNSLPSVMSNTICANWNFTVNVITYYNTVNVQTNNSVTTSCFTNSTMMTAATNVTMAGTNPAGTTSITWLWNQVSATVQKVQVIII